VVLVIYNSLKMLVKFKFKAVARETGKIVSHPIQIAILLQGQLADHVRGDTGSEQ
jgi:hypothetical protein